ncbi:putative ABC transport system permease protein [Alkalibacterium subtropicum]|uniref:Putative ABC transport system permease protein n=1 Tax=Alkalibacterium subtropicum TaxID=753702 RepID=A0A1I1K2I9_9LACT|nr:iron export ABC transporter permease subunit FetB [Alkalibacterium subtropicum]SFC54956.1 putative ABC transport system permease protein [Alkalibacterium subtropicum]
MGANLEINNFSLILSTGLLLVAIFIAYKEKLGLSNDIFIAGVRAVIQLFIIGYVLKYVIEIDDFFLTLVMVLFIVFNAGFNAHKRSEGISNSLLISLAAIGIGTAITLSIMIVSGAIEWIPSQIVPITGMIASNAMVAIGLTYRALNSKFTDQRQQVLEKLALGANEKQASMSIIRESVKTGMSPSIDSTKTVGLVSLPGMMSGLIFAGVDPTEAIRYQIVVMFMLVAVTSIASFIASYLAYREYYNNRKQLII